MTQSTSESRAAIQELLGSGPVAYYRAFAAIGGGVTAGVFLSQLFYWHDRARDPDGWVYKTQAEWEDETGLTRREQETARRHLRERGIIEEKLAGIPARLHYRLDVDRVVELLAERRRTRPSSRAAGSAGDEVAPAQPPASRAETQPLTAAQPPAVSRPPAPAPSAPAQQGAEPALARTRHTRLARSATQARPNPPHQSAQTRHTRLAESAKQARRKAPDKIAQTRQTSLAESASHAETTRDHDTDSSRDHGITHSKEREAAASPMIIRCSLHGAAMYPRQNDGDTWYSHRLPNGVWCRGAPGDQPGDKPDRRSPEERRRRYAEQFAELGFRLARTARATGSPGRAPP